MRQTYLVCYDICDDRRLRKVYKTMRNYGDHLQYSVFECQLTKIDLAKCRHELSEIVKHNEDQVLFVDLGPAEGRGDRGAAQGLMTRRCEVSAKQIRLGVAQRVGELPVSPRRQAADPDGRYAGVFHHQHTSRRRHLVGGCVGGDE